MSKNNYYAIRKGRKSDVIVESWDECEELTSGFKGAEFKGFKIKYEAMHYLDTNLSYDVCPHCKRIIE